MYYLFIRKQADLEKYRREFFRVLEAIESGKTPVQNELRNARTIMFEAFPYQTITGALLMFCTFFLEKVRTNDIMKIGIVLVVNNMCYSVSNYIFTVLKHWLRIRLCARLGIEPSERNIAVMESLEYQSV